MKEDKNSGSAGFAWTCRKQSHDQFLTGSVSRRWRIFWPTKGRISLWYHWQFHFLNMTKLGQWCHRHPTPFVYKCSGSEPKLIPNNMIAIAMWKRYKRNTVVLIWVFKPNDNIFYYLVFKKYIIHSAFTV